MKAVFVLSIVAFLFAGCAPAAATVAPAATTAAPATDATAAATTAAADPTAVCDTDPFGCAVFAPGDTVKIGMGAPMTGGNASYGIDISQGATIAVEDGGDVQGWKFELDAEDDGGTPEGGAAVANKLASDPAVVAVAGHIFSGATSSAMPIYEKAGIPMLSPSATNPALTTTGSKVFNRIAFTDLNQGNAAADYLFNTLGVKKLAAIHDGSDYGKGLADIVVAQFEKDGGEVVDEVAITPGETDYTAVLSAVASKAPEAIFFGGYTAEGAIVANQMKQTGLENAIFFGDDGTYGEDFLARTGANGEGAYATIAPASPDSAAKEAFNAAYLDEFGKEAGSLSPYTWAGYDSAAALISVVKSVAFVGPDGKLYVPRTAMMDGVRSLSNYVGLSGTFTCQDNGECNVDKPQFVVVKDGAWVAADQQ
ncbi:MAG: branched-chain amino acid ABC transporter substrate-binding protein, partial [Anaerolineaceae bacterium]|jgi:branched-chain amino acid transport system substrate-binding protein|nr:branched-chain amino acid ABC transporter substrate-binding protein [Anaerolineaceae bacterium]